jgi:shikimate kinase
MCAGKTTIAKKLAQKLGWQMIDIDRFIENRYHKKINEIFAGKGETGFREIERKILLRITSFDRVVVSTGGGTPCFFDNMDVMNRSGTTVYLQVSAEELADRLDVCKASRPLVKDKNTAEIEVFVRENLAKREPFYRQAQLIFPVEELLSPQEVGHRVDKLIIQLNPKI